MEIPNNPLFEFAKSTVFTSPDFIYFDEVNERDVVRMSDTEFGARKVISVLLSASEGDIIKLQALMCLFSGMTLREAAKVCNKSHEYVRLVTKSIKRSHPELYEVLINNKYRVECLMPTVSTKWTIVNLNSNRKIYTDNLSSWCKKKKVKNHVIQWRLRKKNGVWEDGENKYQIIRNF
jgi:hypothetical protein